MSKIYADIFGLNYSDGRIAGFWIQDFQLATDDREVIFLGDNITWSERFITECKFYNEGQFHGNEGMYLNRNTILQPNLTDSWVIMEREFNIL